MVNAPNMFQPRVGTVPRRCPLQRQRCAIPSIRQCSFLTVPSLPHITASFPAITHQGLTPLKQCIRPRGRTYLLKALRSILTHSPPPCACSPRRGNTSTLPQHPACGRPRNSIYNTEEALRELVQHLQSTIKDLQRRVEAGGGGALDRGTI